MLQFNKLAAQRPGGGMADAEDLKTKTGVLQTKGLSEKHTS